MLDKTQARKFVSVSTYNQLNKLLYELEHVKTPKDTYVVREKLRDLIGKLFTYKEIFELHDEHILELAETISGLYPEREDLNGYLYWILIYLEKQTSKYNQKKEKYILEMKIKEKEKHKNPDTYLDAKYKAWTYTEGYYYQQAHMYRLLYHTLKSLKEYAEKGVICRKRK